tara:strand:+ start:921 stop:1985 length:1065 start_codon:yes stop_codon:yes gene_type:complete
MTPLEQLQNDFKNFQTTSGYTPEKGLEWLEKYDPDNISNLKNSVTQLIGATDKDNLATPNMNMAVGSDPIANNATSGQVANTVRKNISNADWQKFQVNSLAKPTIAKNFGNKQVVSRHQPVSLGRGHLADSIPTELVSGGSNVVSNDSTLSSFIQDNQGAIGAGISGVSAIAGAFAKNKQLDKGISAINKSMDILSDTKYDISGEAVEDLVKLNTDLSESIQSQMVGQVENMKQALKMPESNLRSGKTTELAKTVSRDMEKKLSTLYDSQKSKAKDIKEALLVSADSQTQKINTSLTALESEKDKMIDAQRSNKINAAIDIAKAGVSLVPGVGTVASLGIGAGMDMMKKKNEYT